jgi:hypothetical protein
LYDKETGLLWLIDFGAAREYDASFVTTYLQVCVSKTHCNALFFILEVN